MRRLALILPLLALGAARAEFRLQDLLPEGTLLFAETPSANAFREAFKKTRLYAFFQDEEIRHFGGSAFEALVKNVEGFTKDFEKELGLPWDKAWELPTGQAAFAVPSVAQDDDRQPDLVLALDCAGRRETLLKAVAFARKAYEERSKKKAEVWKAGDDEVVSGELGGDVRFHLSVLGDALVAATWKGTMEDLAAAFRKPRAKPLSRAAAFQRAREKVGGKELFFYADVAGFVKGVKERLGEDERKAVRALGLEGFTTASGALTVGDRFVTERFFLGVTGEKKGLARFLSLKGAATGFEAAPDNALQFLSFSVDVPELYDTVIDILKGTDEVEAQRALDAIAEFEKQVGLSLKDDLFAAFGPRVWAYSALPAEGLVPDAVTCFEIKDAARFDKCLASALKNIPADLGEVLFRGKKIQYFKFKQPGGFGEPARLFLSTVYFLRDGDKLYTSGGASIPMGFGGANALKRHVLRQEKPRLAAAPAVRDWLGGKTGGASLVFYLDLERIFTVAYNTLAPFLTLFKETLGAGPGAVDLMRIPLGETIGKYLAQTVHLVSVEPEGLRVEGVSASGTSLMTAVYAGAAAVVLFPAIERATAEAKTSGCKAQCSSVFFAMVSHHGEKQKYPDRTGRAFLKQLKDLGYLDEEPACPHSGKASYRGPAKDVNQMGDADVVFCDEPGSHPDGTINVLRKNGATETLKPGTDEFTKALETTRGD
jgi:hypothetical protein